jgi:hypothetical protein
LAFDGQQIADRNYTYRQWKATVQPARPDPDRQDNRGTLLYDYKWSRNHWIEASLDTYGGLRRLNVTYNYDMLASNKVGRELGLVDNEPPGAFLARVFAAFGGPQVEIVRGLWREENREFDLMMGEIRRGASRLQAANSSSIGQFARNFYGFTAAAVGDANDIRTGIFETFFARPNFTEDDFEHSLSDDGADRRDEARGSASNMDDGKEEEKGDF